MIVFQKYVLKWAIERGKAQGGKARFGQCWGMKSGSLQWKSESSHRLNCTGVRSESVLRQYRGIWAVYTNRWTHPELILKQIPEIYIRINGTPNTFMACTEVRRNNVTCSTLCAIPLSVTFPWAVAHWHKMGLSLNQDRRRFWATDLQSSNKTALGFSQANFY